MYIMGQSIVLIMFTVFSPLSVHSPFVISEQKSKRLEMIFLSHIMYIHIYCIVVTHLGEEFPTQPHCLLTRWLLHTYVRSVKINRCRGYVL